MQPLSSQWRRFLLVRNLIFWVIILLLPFIFAGKDALGWFVLEAIFVIPLFLIIWISIALSWKYYSYQIDETDLTIRHGVISKAVDSIPFRNIKNVNVKQGLLGQLFGFANLEVYTGANSNNQTVITNGIPMTFKRPDGFIPGIDPHEAEALREKLNGLTQNQPVTIVPGDQPV